MPNSELTKTSNITSRPQVYVFARIAEPSKPVHSVGVWLSPDLKVGGARERILGGPRQVALTAARSALLCAQEHAASVILAVQDSVYEALTRTHQIKNAKTEKLRQEVLRLMAVTGASLRKLQLEDWMHIGKLPDVEAYSFRLALDGYKPPTASSQIFPASFILR